MIPLRRLSLLAVLWALLPAAQAATLDGELEVESAFINVASGVYQLYARIKYPANDSIVVALRDGVSLSYELDCEIARERRYWFDAGLTAITLRRELSFHAVSDRYIVREQGAAEQASFPTLDAALEYLGRVDGWPILVSPQVRPATEYRVSVRARVRRGRLTDTLRVLLFWTNDWQRESEWYSWSLPR